MTLAELTCDDLAAIAEVLRRELDDAGYDESLYLAGLRAGYRRGIEDAAKCCDFGSAHTYASENADHYRGFDAGVERCRDRIRKLAE